MELARRFERGYYYQVTSHRPQSSGLRWEDNHARSPTLKEADKPQLHCVFFGWVNHQRLNVKTQLKGIWIAYVIIHCLKFMRQKNALMLSKVSHYYGIVLINTVPEKIIIYVIVRESEPRKFMTGGQPRRRGSFGLPWILLEQFTCWLQEIQSQRGRVLKSPGSLTCVKKVP